MGPPTQPPPRPVPRPVPSGPVDPFNCAVDAVNTWAADKKAWCCRVHHLGCPQPILPPVAPILPPVMPIAPAAPADPYNCADGFANWQAGWSHLASVRLQCGVRQLDGGMECAEEDMVLPEWRKRMPTSSGRLRLSRMDRLVCKARS